MKHEGMKIMLMLMLMQINTGGTKLILSCNLSRQGIPILNIIIISTINQCRKVLTWRADILVRPCLIGTLHQGGQECPPSKNGNNNLHLLIIRVASLTGGSIYAPGGRFHSLALRHHRQSPKLPVFPEPLNAQELPPCPSMSTCPSFPRSS